MNITEPIRKSSLGNSTASDVITYLLKCGANINSVDNYNQTPLNYAAVKGNIEAMVILLKWPGIDVEVLIFLFRCFLFKMKLQQIKGNFSNCSSKWFKSILETILYFHRHWSLKYHLKMSFNIIVLIWFQSKTRFFGVVDLKLPESS